MKIVSMEMEFEKCIKYENFHMQNKQKDAKILGEKIN